MSLGTAGCLTGPEREYRELTKKFGPEWKLVDKEHRDRFKEQVLKERADLTTLHKIYASPKEFYSSLNEEEAREFEEFQIGDLSKERLASYKKEMKFVNFENPSLSDKLLIYLRTNNEGIGFSR